MNRRLAFAALGGLALTAAACNTRGPSPTDSTGRTGGDTPAVKVEIGGHLFATKPYPRPAAAAGTTVDPLTLAANVHVVDKVDIPSQRDGKIEFIGTELKAGERHPAAVTRKYKGEQKQYRPLQPGDYVEAGQLVMILDNREAQAEYDIRFAAVEPAKGERDSARVTLDAVQQILDRHMSLGKNTTTDIEVLKARVDVARAGSDLKTKDAGYTKAVEELKKAEVLLDMYYIRSNVSGYIQPFNRTAGEGVRAGETIFQIHSTQKLRAEGFAPTGFQRRLKRGMPVVVEPSFEVTEDRTLWGHRGAVTGIAVSNHPTDPQIVTASEDKTVRVWTRAGEQKQLRHDVAVRSVACTPAGVKQNLCLSGADDGNARLWDLNQASPEGRVLKGPDAGRPVHKGVITAVAFSPDGKYCATADSRDICVWTVADAALLYKVQVAHHQGEINALTFTPQAKLVSASRDNTIAVWALGEKNANLETVLEGRSGDVARPGVSHDGRRLLFDVAQSLRVLTLPDQKAEAVMQNVNDTYKFGGFAQFTPDDKYVLTGTNVESRLSLWKAPTPQSRAAELRQFVPRGKQVAFTCAAASPAGQQPFAAAGTRDGTVYVWPLPTEAELKEPLRGVITFIDNTTEANSRQVRVWAEFDNAAGAVMPGGTVTIVVENPTTAGR